MKNAPTTNSSESAPYKRDYTPGSFPKRTNTVLASVLASLLESNVLTGMESVFKMSTTRLSAVIYALSERYDLTAERRAITTGTSDGRVAWITAYWLPQETIAQAFEDGARAWIEEVKSDSAKRRKLAGKCKQEAARINAARAHLRQHDPRQFGLWGNHE